MLMLLNEMANATEQMAKSGETDRKEMKFDCLFFLFFERNWNQMKLEMRDGIELIIGWTRNGLKDGVRIRIWNKRRDWN